MQKLTGLCLLLMLAWAAASCGSGTAPPAPQPARLPQPPLPAQSAASSADLYSKLEAVGDLALEARVQYAAHAVPPSLSVEQAWKMPADYGYMISSQGELVRIDFEAFSVVRIKSGSKDTWLRVGKVTQGPASYIAVIDKHNPKLDSAPHTVTLAGCAYPVKFFSPGLRDNPELKSALSAYLELFARMEAYRNTIIERIKLIQEESKNGPLVLREYRVGFPVLSLDLSFKYLSN